MATDTTDTTVSGFLATSGYGDAEEQALIVDNYCFAYGVKPDEIDSRATEFQAFKEWVATSVHRQSNGKLAIPPLADKPAWSQGLLDEPLRDWTVSIRPAAGGMFATPSGVRFDFNGIRDGVQPEQIIELVTAFDKAVGQLLESGSMELLGGSPKPYAGPADKSAPAIDPQLANRTPQDGPAVAPTQQPLTGSVAQEIAAYATEPLTSGLVGTQYDVNGQMWEFGSMYTVPVIGGEYKRIKTGKNAGRFYLAIYSSLGNPDYPIARVFDDGAIGILEQRFPALVEALSAINRSANSQAETGYIDLTGDVLARIKPDRKGNPKLYKNRPEVEIVGVPEIIQGRM